MTAELAFIFEEIEALNDKWADLQMLLSLANNAVYALNKLQNSSDYAQLSAKQQQAVADTIGDILGTMSKELTWAQECQEGDAERGQWFRKSKRQILEDMQKLFG